MRAFLRLLILLSLITPAAAQGVGGGGVSGGGAASGAAAVQGKLTAGNCVVGAGNSTVKDSGVSCPSGSGAFMATTGAGATAGALESLIAAAGRTLSLPLNFATAPSGTNPSFIFPSSSVGGNFSLSELMLTGGTAAQNVLTVRNSNSGGFSAYTARGDDNCEHVALGWVNSAASYAGGNSFTYLEDSNFCASNPTPGVAKQAPQFKLTRTGYKSNNTVQTLISLNIDNSTTGIEGAWNWLTIGGSPSNTTMVVDPTNDVVTVNNKLLVGNINTVITPISTLDNYGHATFGSAITSRSSDCATWVVCVDENTNSSLRIIHSLVAKMDFSIISGSPITAQFIDTDHSSIVPLKLSLDGTGNIAVGGGIVAAALPTSCSGKPTGTLWNNVSILNVCP